MQLAHASAACLWCRRIPSDAAATCAAQGIPFGVTTERDEDKCSTPEYLCPSPLALPSPPAPCCTPCSDFLSSGNWFWQCRIPPPTNVRSQDFTFEMLAGQFFPMGRCVVTVTAAQVTVSNCEVASTWSTSVVHFYLGETPSTTCAPGRWGGTFELAAPATGNLGPAITRTLTRSSATSDIFVMLHMGVSTPELN
jgi:hypothetical protein